MQIRRVLFVAALAWTNGPSAQAAEPPTAAAGSAPSRSERLAWQAATEFLGLTSSQRGRLADASRTRDQALLALTQQAQRLAPARDAKALAHLCEQARSIDGQHRGELRLLLAPAQLERLQLLEQAMSLLPAVESAQAAGLLAGSVAVPPLGLPAGQVESDYRWQRVPAPALPGCAASKVRPGVNIGPDRPQPK